MALMLSVVASCSNDGGNAPAPAPGDGLLSMKLAKQPDVNIWSGSNVLAGSLPESRADEVDGDEVNVKYLNEEVEINLSLNDVHKLDGTDNQKYDVADLISKLSIHLRSGVDLKVVLPVAKEYYCDQDDMYIFNQHGGEIFANGGLLGEEKHQSVTIQFGKSNGEVLPPTGGDQEESGNSEDSDVKGARGEEEADGDFEISVDIQFNEADITITTSGVTNEAIDWLKENYEDGLNIEVYNYFNRANNATKDDETVYAEWTLTQLKKALDASTVEFTNGTPDYFINAFTGTTTTLTTDGVQETVYRDCYVTPNPTSNFWAPYFDYHFNGYDENLIYVNVTLENPEKSLTTEELNKYKAE